MIVWRVRRANGDQTNNRIMGFITRTLILHLGHFAILNKIHNIHLYHIFHHILIQQSHVIWWVVGMVCLLIVLPLFRLFYHHLYKKTQRGLQYLHHLHMSTPDMLSTKLDSLQAAVDTGYMPCWGGYFNLYQTVCGYGGQEE